VSRSQRIVALLPLLASALCFARVASAQEDVQPGFGEKYRFVLALENVGGVARERFDSDSSEDASTLTQAGLFTPLVFPASTGARMRLGLHYFVAPPISLGALLSYSDNDEYGDYLQAGARVGVAFSLSPSTAIWLRAGAVYVRTEFGFGDSTTTTSNIVPGGEALLVMRPVDHFGFLLGPFFDIGVNGKIEDDDSDASADFDYMAYGLSFGVLGDF
jgi:hypothetical protein